jgi:hypothetical protein
MNSQQFTAELQKALDGALTARPYNRFEPAESYWWLVPSSDWPAFKYGKYIINPIPGTDKFEVGFDLEKGHSSDILQVYGDTKGNKAQVMDDTWAWRDLIPKKFALIKTKFTNVEAIGLASKLKIIAEPYDSSRGDPESANQIKSSSITLAFHNDTFSVESTSTDDQPDTDITDLISNIKQDPSLESLLELVADFDKQGWHWLSIVACIETAEITDKLVSFLHQFDGWV